MLSFGKRAGGQVSEVGTFPPAQAAYVETKTQETTSTVVNALLNLNARWWIQAGVGRCHLLALLNSGASHMTMGAIVLQIASDCGKIIRTRIQFESKNCQW